MSKIENEKKEYTEEEVEQAQEDKNKKVIFDEDNKPIILEKLLG